MSRLARASLASLVALALVCCGAPPAPPTTAAAPALPPAAVVPPSSPPSADVRYETLWKQFLDEYLRRRPVDATTLGMHAHDADWPDLSAGAEAEDRRFYERVRSELAAIPAAELTAGHRLDATILARTLAYFAFVQDELRPAENDPLDAYVRVIGDGLDPLVSRDFEPAPARARDLASRLATVPAIVAAARARVGKPARIVTETAIRQAKGLVGLVEGGFPELLAQAPDQRAAVLAAGKIAGAAVRDLAAFLERDVLSRSTGDFRVGAAKLDKILRLTLDADVDPAELLARARATLTRTQDEMAETSTALWPELFGKRPLPATKTPEARKALVRQVLARLAEDRPNGKTIVADATQVLAKATDFVREKALATLPPEPCKVMEMPEYERGVAIAFCEAAGPLEPKAETHVTISPAPADWPPARVASFYREYNASMLTDLIVHEAMPGHYLQLMHMNRVKDAPRAVFSNGALVEGWAVYAEWLMAHHGFGGARVRLQRQKMLARVCANAILDHDIHAGTMDEKAALALMENEAFQEEGEAVGKWTRARVTAGQLSSYFYGFSEMLRLREAAEKAPGFDEKAWHDRVLGFGAPSLHELAAELAR